jgi:Domain of unknown function (DUF4926)
LVTVIRAEEMRMPPAPFDTVELLEDLPAYNLRSGSLGAIVHAYDDGTYEVEFTNAEGKTTALCPLSVEQFIVVWQAKTRRWLPVAEHVAALVSHMPEEAGREVLDFARFLYERRQRQGSAAAAHTTTTSQETST